MPRPMLEKPQEQTQSQPFSLLSATQTQQMDKMKMDRLLRKTRSQKYMDALHKLDSGGHTHNQSQVDAIIANVRQEFPEVELSGILLGYVSRCYLGDPYEVHTLDMASQIIEHYKKGQMLPGGMEKARSIALCGGYDVIEVYVDCCRAISANGAVSVISY